MHENRIVYNDLKPENMLIFNNEKVLKFSDFDTSIILDDL